MLKLLPKKEKPDYEDFYSSNYGRVLYYVKNKINSVEDAEDLTSEVFVYCYSHYDDYDPEKSSITTSLCFGILKIVPVRKLLIGLTFLRVTCVFCCRARWISFQK